MALAIRANDSILSFPPLETPYSSKDAVLHRIWSVFQSAKIYFEYIGGFISVVVGLIPLKNIICECIALSKRVTYHVMQDAGKYAQTLIENIIHFASCCMTVIPFLINLSGHHVAQQVLLILNSITTVIGSLFFLWEIVKQSYGLSTAYKIKAVIDRALQCDSPEDKIKNALFEYEEILQARAINAEVVCAASSDPEIAKKLHDQDTCKLMENRFGTHAYKAFKKAAEERDIDQKLRLLQHVQAMMHVKIVNHWLDIVACVIAIVGVIFSAIFPALGFINLVAWASWALAGSSRIHDLVAYFQTDQRLKQIVS